MLQVFHGISKNSSSGTAEVELPTELSSSSNHVITTTTMSSSSSSAIIDDHDNQTDLNVIHPLNKKIQNFTLFSVGFSWCFIPLLCENIFLGFRLKKYNQKSRSISRTLGALGSAKTIYIFSLLFLNKNKLGMCIFEMLIYSFLRKFYSITFQ